MSSVEAKLSYISLFSSGGIGDIGFRDAGFECIASAELLSRRLEVQRLNGIANDEDLICGDLLDPFVFDKVISRASKFMGEEKQPVTALIATPPCQGMSVANHKKKDELGRNSLVVRSIEAVLRVKPLIFIFENVPAFIKTVCTGMDGENRAIGDEIERVLGNAYEFYSKTLQLSDFGSPSSRKRSITVGVRNDISWVTPLDFFPDKATPPSLRELIGDLPRLHVMGEHAEGDILHSFRKYDQRMRPWISDLAEGQSAFDNADEMLRPHRIVDGMIIPNVRKNGDKYRRVFWDAVAPCVHTRNDILASQNTVHPEDDRVFSIRELMMMLGLPKEFVWFDGQEEAQQSGDISRVKSHEINIRQCLGEAIPAPITFAIANAIRLKMIPFLNLRASRPRLSKTVEWVTEVQKASYRELDKSYQKEFSAYYTQPLPAFAVLKRAFSRFRGSKKTISVLEPAAGSGVFPIILDQMIENEKVVLHLNDLSEKVSQELLNLSTMLENVLECVVTNKDFLEHEWTSGFDLIIGNPPFGIAKRRGVSKEKGKSNEISILFYLKALTLAKRIGFVFPKALLHAQKYRILRDEIENTSEVSTVLDYGETAFPNVLVETIGIVSELGKNFSDSVIEVKSWPRQCKLAQTGESIHVPGSLSWTIYRDDDFDAVLKKNTLGRFRVWRDRKISRKHGCPEGTVRVIRGRNLGKDDCLLPDDNDYFVSKEVADPIISRINSFEEKSLFLAPNLSYYPRVVQLEFPLEVLPEGSCAVLRGDLTPKEEKRFVEFASSEEFERFYRIACNYSTRSLNIDDSLCYWWAVPVN